MFTSSRNLASNVIDPVPLKKKTLSSSYRTDGIHYINAAQKFAAMLKWVKEGEIICQTHQLIDYSPRARIVLRHSGKAPSVHYNLLMKSIFTSPVLAKVISSSSAMMGLSNSCKSSSSLQRSKDVIGRACSKNISS